MGGVGEKEQMNQMPNAQRPTLNAEVSADGTTSNIKHRTSNIFWRILGLIIAGIFIYAGAIKALDPVQFASDIDNYKILPWPISVALAFYLPWLEIFCGFALVVGLFYRGALLIFTVLVLVFTLVTIAARVRGLDITCGCFGHASQNWSFPAHLATNVAILSALLALWFQSAAKRPATTAM
jgi:putative oxidoreductase